ncbi:MAG TPA: DNA gyrase subunit B, partial [Pseudomonadales bacterium]|nr:DNA gyrase subunit B [Pseudomonadales bacterium]
GYVYIAQPPLYKVKKGKQEQYLKDEKALQDYLTEVALENAGLHVNDSAPAITGLALQDFVFKYQTVLQIIQRLSRVYPPVLLESMIDLPLLKEDDFKSREQIALWSSQLNSLLNKQAKPSERFDVQVVQDEERHIYLPEINALSHGLTRAYRLGHDFFRSQEYKTIADLATRLSGLLEEGAYVKRGERSQTIKHFKEALEWLMTEAKRGQNISRYKGLGEMNPEQLWETTMDPETRRMLKVTIQDAIAADQIFTTLMGDHVEPRRDFIEMNALNVSNLDI